MISKGNEMRILQEGQGIFSFKLFSCVAWKSPIWEKIHVGSKRHLSGESELPDEECVITLSFISLNSELQWEQRSEHWWMSRGIIPTLGATIHEPYLTTEASLLSCNGFYGRFLSRVVMMMGS